MTELAIFGRDLFGDIIKPKATGPLAERFTFPPFSVLDARAGEWQERKRAWRLTGIEGEIGRTGSPGGSPMPSNSYLKDGCRGDGTGRAIPGTEKTTLVPDNGRGGLGDTSATAMDYFNGGKTIAGDSGSLFDPVLCELAYRWWCPPGGQVVDPFAGGAVRGVVAGMLGFRYWGCDLRREQIEANRRQAIAINPEVAPVWVCGDSMEHLVEAPDADFVFSCPPYGDLEQYSDDPADLSTMEWHTFATAYRRIIMRAVGRLLPNRFACFVVGDFRDPRGFYRNFVGETVAAFQQCEARLYNEAVLVTAVGTASIRATRQFDGGRKLCKTHQNLLVFCKGDWRRASEEVCAKQTEKAEVTAA